VETRRAVVLDAGTGRRTRRDDGTRAGAPRTLLSHLHMIILDSVLRRPVPPDLEVHIWGPVDRLGLRPRLTRYLSPPLSRCDYAIAMPPLGQRCPTGTFELPGMEVRSALSVIRAHCRLLPDDGHSTLVYMSDHEPALGARHFPDLPRWTSGFDLAQGADVLIHDAQYSDDEYPHHIGWGHSSIGHAVTFATLAGVGHLVGFHHDPWRDDEALEEIYTPFANSALRHQHTRA
jgi:hypothetical protein